MFGIQVGQTLEILNSDETLHNIHALPMANREFNRGQALQGMKYTTTFSTPEVMVPFKCDVHKWMNAWVGVLDHPFFAVTGKAARSSSKGCRPAPTRSRPGTRSSARRRRGHDRRKESKDDHVRHSRC